jgi:hypothetical protein
MRRLIWTSLLSATLLIAPAVTMLAAPVRATTTSLLVLRTGLGLTAGLATVRTGGGPTESLPLGLLDQSGHLLYAARAQTDGTTVVQVIDVATNQTLRSMKIKGAFSTRSGDYAAGAVLPAGFYGTVAPVATLGRASLAAGVQRAGLVSAQVPLLRPVDVRMPSVAHAGFPADGSQVLSALSFNARWLALREETSQSSVADTHIIVIDTQRMRVVADKTLHDMFGLDAITADGKILYLIQSLPNVGYGAYQVRSFDVARSVLDSKVIVERGEKPGSMSGEAWTRVWSRDGSWLYTLYVENSGHAFVHALNLQARKTLCLDFPPISKNISLMAHFTLSASPDGRTLYAVNPVLGAVVAVQNLPVGKMRLARLTLRAGAPMRTQAAAAISADGKSVFVATGTGVWVIDTRTLKLKSTYVPDQEVASVAVSHDGNRLFVLSPTSGTIDVLNPSNGADMDGIQPSANAWAIEGVR